MFMLSSYISTSLFLPSQRNCNNIWTIDFFVLFRKIRSFIWLRENLVRRNRMQTICQCWIKSSARRCLVVSGTVFSAVDDLTIGFNLRFWHVPMLKEFNKSSKVLMLSVWPEAGMADASVRRLGNRTFVFCTAAVPNLSQHYIFDASRCEKNPLCHLSMHWQGGRLGWAV